MTISSILQDIPCTLVTGFLGSGKTTIINQLLTAKTEGARWALLINEFGRIGIDGALLASAQNRCGDKSQIAISEVSGGCICCTSQLPLQIALTRLLADHRPERLIIEPTGLAHPRELIRQLSAPHWQTALSMQAVITVLSGVQWQNEKYRTHEGFQAHVRAADVVVINRYEQFSENCQQDLQQWVATLNPQAKIIWVDSPIITNTESTPPSIDKLTAQLNNLSQTIYQQRAENSNKSRIRLQPPKQLLSSNIRILSSNVMINDQLPYRYHDTQQGMFQQEVLLGGWRLPAHWIFDAKRLQQWLLKLPHWQRIKGVVHTTDGWLQINFTPDSPTINATSAQLDSRLEIILLDKENRDINIKKMTKDKDEQRANWATWDSELMALIL
ncbi:GTP-binding protein [Psychrobacter frigidicola]|uniref:GTP-binding protein n=1 Tax=Psychrobacter frigidicola TaxID=45611 RepID=A0A5C7A0H0_9GAMM|nr:CobW family GTP-binding protein [Psychrobacter frigidicola]TXD96894.1 GTP-binding protein [Psychrobacter frigidicola]